MDSCPKELEPYIKAYKLQRKTLDENMWQMGMYVMNALEVSLERALAGNKAKNKYPEKPMLFDFFDERTQEEKDEEALRKMLLAEEQWHTRHTLHGLKEGFNDT